MCSLQGLPINFLSLKVDKARGLEAFGVQPVPTGRSVIVGMMAGVDGEPPEPPGGFSLPKEPEDLLGDTEEKPVESWWNWHIRWLWLRLVGKPDVASQERVADDSSDSLPPEQGNAANDDFSIGLTEQWGNNQVMVTGEELTLGVDLGSDEVLEMPSSGVLAQQESEAVLTPNSAAAVCLVLEENDQGEAQASIVQSWTEACDEASADDGRQAFLEEYQAQQEEVSHLETERENLKKKLLEYKASLEETGVKRAESIRRANSLLDAQRRQLRAERLAQEAERENQRRQSRWLMRRIWRQFKRLLCCKTPEPETAGFQDESNH